jgi:hypothetical protein
VIIREINNVLELLGRVAVVCLREDEVAIRKADGLVSGLYATVNGQLVALR